MPSSLGPTENERPDEPEARPILSSYIRKLTEAIPHSDLRDL